MSIVFDKMGLSVFDFMVSEEFSFWTLHLVKYVVLVSME